MTVTARERPDLRGPILLLAGWALVVMGWFYFAFAEAGPARPWLASAQAICFGSNPDGLPSSWGWAVLILSPLSLLAGIVGAFGGDLQRALRGLRQASWTGLVLGLLAAGLLVEGVWVLGRVRQGLALAAIDFGPSLRGSLPADWPRLDRSLPAIKLTDQHGLRVALKPLDGKPQLMTFVFSHCATVCPFLIGSTLQAHQALQDRVGLTYIALDPWRDTPSSLPSLARRWQLPPSARLLSGEPELVARALRELGVPSARDLKSGDIEHPALIYVVDAQGRVAYALNNPPAAWLVQAVQRLEQR